MEDQPPSGTQPHSLNYTEHINMVAFFLFLFCLEKITNVIILISREKSRQKEMDEEIHLKNVPKMKYKTIATLS